MEVGLSTALNYSNSNLNTQKQENEKTPSKEAELQQQKNEEKKGVEKTEKESTVFDDKAEDILDAMLQDRLENEKYALKSMLEQTLSPQGDFLSKDRLLQRLDDYIEDKKQGLNVGSSPLMSLASTLKTLYESDFKPLNFTV